MKVEEQNVATFNVGRKETAVAQIQASAKAFEILSSGLYSDAEFAIVREIAANARDSHKVAGKLDTPFRVQIPTSLDPRFCIRDYGTSMSHQFMMTRVNTYFDSTKNDNNDEIGGFGLGIKSVFSYTTSFMIACFQGGQRRVYVYQIGEQGLPEISLMAESETDEADGVEVSIPVKADDYQKFVNAVKKTFAFYDVKPEVCGLELSIPEFVKVVEGTNWFVCNDSATFNREVYVEMGGIAYPVENDVHGLSFYGRNQTLFLKAGIGEIDITPNREQVKMTEKTTKFIKASIKAAGQELQDNVQTTVDDANYPNYWEMVDYLNKLNSDMIRKLGFDRSGIKYNGQHFADNDFPIRTVLKPSLVDPSDPSQGYNAPVITNSMVPGMLKINTWEMSRTMRIKRNDATWRGDQNTSFDRFTRPNSIVVLEDRQSAHVGRWMRANPNGDRTITVITAETGKSASVVAKIKELLQDYDGVLNAIDLTYEKQIAGTTRVERKFYIYHTAKYEAVTRTEIDLETLPDELYYIATDGRQKGELFGREVDFKNEEKFLATARSWLGDAQIYFLTEPLLAKIQKHRDDIELKLVGPALEAMVEDKVRAASANYVSRDLDAIQAPFSRSAGHWRTQSALEFWSKKFNLGDWAKAKEQLKSHQPDTGLEKMVYLIAKKQLTDLFAEYNVEVRTITCPNFDAMLEKMPYAFTMANDYNQPEVIEHIRVTMGWSTDAEVKDEDEDYD